MSAALAPAPELPAAPPSPAEVRAWAQREGHVVSDRGRVRGRLVEAYLRARAGDT